MDVSDIKHWQSMGFVDADRMGAWLVAIGFREHAVHRDEQDPAVVVHGEWVREGGGVMGGTARPDQEGQVAAPGSSSAYLVTDDPDGLVERAVAAGASVVRPVTDQDYGGRGGTVRDPEGNHWAVGSYQPS